MYNQNIMKAPYKALTVANFFVVQSLNSQMELTPMKVIKLTYIAHGWYLALFNKPLISDVVSAWQYGPVIPSLYQAFKSYGKRQIDSVFPTSENEIISEQDENFLKKIWNDYGVLSGLQLSTITHMKDTPWFKVYNTKYRNSDAIPNDIIKEHYSEKWKSLRKREVVT